MNETLEFVLLLTMGLLAILVAYMVKMNWDFMNHILPRLENVEICFVGVRDDLELVKGFDTLVEAAERVVVARVSDSRDSSNVDDYYDDDDVLRKDDGDDVPKIIERLTEARKKKKKVRTY